MSFAAVGTLCFRVDAHPDIGLGHAMRCLALAQEWQRKGGEVAMITAWPQFLPQEWNSTVNVHLIPLPADIQSGSPADAQWVREWMLDNNAKSWLVLDGYPFDSVYLQVLQQAESPQRIALLVINDFLCKSIPEADLILNQNPQNARISQADGVADSSLIGLRYALLRRPFVDAAQQAELPERPVCLASFGGSDPAKVSERWVHWLGTLGAGVWPGGLRPVLVIGAANPRGESLRALAGCLPNGQTLEVLVDPPDWPEWMRRAGLAFTAAGSTCWELAALRVAMIVTVTADNQAAGATAFCGAGGAISAGVADAGMESRWTQALQKLADPELRKELGSRAGALVDGRGVPRVVQKMRSRRLTLRLAEAEDEDRILEWANDPLSRAASFRSDPIPQAEHRRWWHAALANPDLSLLLAELDGQALGFVRFNLGGPAPAGWPDSAEIGINLNPDFRGAGWASALIEKATAAYLRDKSSHSGQENLAATPSRVHAWIKRENRASLRAFQAAGYRLLEPTAHPQGYPAVCLGFTESHHS